MNLETFEPSDKIDYRGEALNCPPNFVSKDDKCIRGFIDELNWFEAEENCNSLVDLITGQLRV